MVVDTIKENVCINKLVTTKKEVIFVEGDMIVPDSKPDILNTICTSGVVCIYKKEILEGKVKFEGSINTYIMYMADDSNDKVRGLTTNLDFIESIAIPNCRENMSCKLSTNLKSIEAKVINGRKVGIKAALEVQINIYENEEVDVINDIQEKNDIQILKEDIKINSLLGVGDTKIYAKENINIDNIDNLAEILKACVTICGKDTKISYNKILTKAEADIKIMYLTEDNRINSVNSKIPIVGFIDMPNISEQNILDIDYEIKNIILKPNSAEEHSIYVELEVLVTANVYEEKQINLIQDLYNLCENIEFNKKRITTITNKENRCETKQIREKINLEGLEGKNIIDVDVIPTIEKQNNIGNNICEGNLELIFILSNDELQVDKRIQKIPFNIEAENINKNDGFNNIEISVLNSDFIVQDNMVDSNIELEVNTKSYRNSNINIIDQIENTGEKEQEDYSVIMYIVKKGDTLWEIAKRFNTTVDEIVRVNGIENPDVLDVGQKIFIPRYQKVVVNEYA